MKLVFACLAVLFLASSIARPKRKKMTVAESFKEANITKLLNITAPENLLGVYFGYKEVYLGNYIYPGDTVPEYKDDPIFTIEYEPANEADCLWTLVYLDDNYDNVDPEKYPKGVRTLLLGLIVNIRNVDLESGDELAKPITHSPRPGTGYHTYIFLYMRQNKEIDVSCQPDYENVRIGFDLGEFAKNNYLCPPEAGNYYNTSFPDSLEVSCKGICEEYQYKYKPRRH